MASTPLFPHNREGHDLAGQAVLTPPVPPRPHWCETAPFLEVHASPVIAHAIVMGHGCLWCVGDEDFREQQQPDQDSYVPLVAAMSRRVACSWWAGVPENVGDHFS
jgi:hypothetical protein